VKQWSPSDTVSFHVDLQAVRKDPGGRQYGFDTGLFRPRSANQTAHLRASTSGKKPESGNRRSTASRRNLLLVIDRNNEQSRDLESDLESPRRLVQTDVRFLIGIADVDERFWPQAESIDQHPPGKQRGLTRAVRNFPMPGRKSFSTQDSLLKSDRLSVVLSSYVWTANVRYQPCNVYRSWFATKPQLQYNIVGAVLGGHDGKRGRAADGDGLCRFAVAQLRFRMRAQRV